MPTRYQVPPLPSPKPPTPHVDKSDLRDFDGQTYEPPLDSERLTNQLRRVFDAMGDGRWRTPPELQALIEANWASISARLRDFRKAKFGQHILERRRRGPGRLGLFEYRLIKASDSLDPVDDGQGDLLGEVQAEI